MPIRTAVWKVAEKPKPLAESSLAKEQLRFGALTSTVVDIRASTRDP